MAEADVNDLKLQLLDIYQPDSVSWWPLAPAWWLFILVTILLGLLLVYLYYKKTALRRAAMQQLNSIEQAFFKQGDINQLAMSLNILLKQILLSRATDDFIPGLTGKAWLNFLDQSCNSQDFTQGIGILLHKLPYQKTNHCNDENNKLAQELIALIKYWTIKNT
jgi:hypothetical protein